MNDLYLTSTFTNPWNVDFNSKIGSVLESKGLRCFLPHRDTNQKGSEYERFTQDLEGMRNSKIILAVAENESPNWGAELGYAYGMGKPILALANTAHRVPLICNGMLTDTFCVDNLDAVHLYIDSLVEKIVEMAK